MNARTYFAVTAAVFAVVALAHLARVVLGWPVVIGTWNAPMWLSWLGFVVPGVLAALGFSLVGRGSRR